MEEVIERTQALATRNIAPTAPTSPAVVYLARLAPGSRRSQRTALETLAELASGGRYTAETCPWRGLRYQHTQALRSALADRYAVATANRHLAALKGVLREAWRLGQMSSEDFQRAIDLAPVRGSTLPAGRSLSSVELARLFEVCAADPSAAGARDGAMLALLYTTGLRRDEAVRLDLEDINQGAMRIRGKGNKERLCPLPAGAKPLLRRWISFRRGALGPFLCPVTKTGRVVLRRMSAEALVQRLQLRATQAGVAHFSPHDLRRSFVGDLLDRGADIATVQKLVGHAKIDTTTRYDRRGEASRRRAAELITVPTQVVGNSPSRKEKG
jgi:site-specific recombinase XerD